MLGAGLIKVRGDSCWRDLTCMNYFYNTQPNPNPLAYFAHQAPAGWHAFETLGSHLITSNNRQQMIIYFSFFYICPCYDGHYLFDTFFAVQDQK